MFSIIRELASSLLFWEIAGYISTGVVILGCIGEYAAEFTRIPRDDDHKHKISKLSLIILTAGIAGELLTAVRSSQISGHVISDLQTAVRDARSAAHDAGQFAIVAQSAAGGAQIKADAVDKKADALNERLNLASSKLGTIEGRLIKREPRANRLEDKARRDKFQAALAPFKGQKFGIRFCAGEDNEMDQLDAQLLTVIWAGDTRWKLVGDAQLGIKTNMMACKPGILLFIDQHSSSTSQHAASALHKALEDSGIDVAKGVGQLDASKRTLGFGPTPNVIMILIGTQP